MALKTSILSILLLTTAFHTGFSVAQQQAPADIYSVVERKLERSTPLATNTNTDDQEPWFNLYNDILVFNSPQRAYDLLKKLNYRTESSLNSLSRWAAWTAKYYGADKGMLILSQIGLEKPNQVSSYESFVNDWVTAKQPEKALQLISLDKSAKSHYLPSVLAAYQDAPEKSVAIYQDHVKSNDKAYFQHYKMLIAIAENFRAKEDKANTALYTDQALVMLDKAIAAGSVQARSSYYQHLLTPMELYAFAGNTEQAVKMAASVLKATGNKGYEYDDAIPEILAFYKNNGLTKEYRAQLALHTTAMDKIFGFAPTSTEAGEFISMLSELGEVSLMNERIDTFINAAEYACYDSHYCYEHKVKALKHLDENKQNALFEKYLNIIVAESQNELFPSWKNATKYIVATLVDIGHIDEAKRLTTEAEAIFRSTLKEFPPREVESDYIDLAEMYGTAGDATAAQRVLDEQNITSQEHIVIGSYIKNQQWSKARELVVKEKWLSTKNQQLLKNLCLKNTPECMQHINFTLNALLAQNSSETEDSIGNRQLYQIGAIYHSLKISPTAEQQQLIQQLYEKAAGKDVSSST